MAFYHFSVDIEQCVFDIRLAISDFVYVNGKIIIGYLSTQTTFLSTRM